MVTHKLLKIHFCKFNIKNGVSFKHPCERKLYSRPLLVWIAVKKRFIGRKQEFLSIILNFLYTSVIKTKNLCLKMNEEQINVKKLIPKRMKYK